MENETKQKDSQSKHDEVTIHIDKQTYESPNPTTGVALYRLALIDSTQYDLFLEVHDKGDDEFIANNESLITLKNGGHFYTAQKNLNPGISKNGRRK